MKKFRKTIKFFIVIGFIGLCLLINYLQKLPPFPTYDEDLKFTNAMICIGEKSECNPVSNFSDGIKIKNIEKLWICGEIETNIAEYVKVYWEFVEKPYIIASENRDLLDESSSYCFSLSSAKRTEFPIVHGDYIFRMRQGRFTFYKLTIHLISE